MNNNISILEQEYVEPERPYSQKELQYIRDRNFRSLRVGKVRAEHDKCQHFYYVKENGRKEKEIKEKNCNDIGNCSVCWKMTKTPKHLRSRGNNMVTAYCDTFYNTPKFLNYDKVDLETIFYKWLYGEFV